MNNPPINNPRPRRPFLLTFQLLTFNFRKLLILLLASPFLLFQAAVYLLPNPSPPTLIPPSTFLLDRSGQPLAAFIPDNSQFFLPLSGSQISPHLFTAIVAAEDHRFYSHQGVDWCSAAGAAWSDLTSLHIARGASTLTMQLYRLGHPQERSFLFKLEQSIYAEKLERTSSKLQILTDYLNRAPFGGNLTGVGAASWRYFAKPCSELSLAQAALLAGLPQSPNRLRPDRNPQPALDRRNLILKKMLDQKLITQDAFAQATQEPLNAQWHDLPQTRLIGPHADGALAALLTLAQSSPGQTIQTTLDTTIQRRALALTQSHLTTLPPNTSAALIVLNTQTAEILATLSCDQSPSTPQPINSLTHQPINPSPLALDLTRRPRSSGSTLKPFIYAAAFDSGQMTASSIIDDSPKVWAGYLPVNFDHDFLGQITVATALAQSRNIPAMVTLAKVGIPRATGIMQAAGLNTLANTTKPYGLSLAIGGAEVTATELAQSYATLARNGIFIPATFTPLTPDGNPGPSHAPTTNASLAPFACTETLAALSQPDRTRALAPQALPMNPAWKTGTSSGNRDAWCAAVTPAYTVVVWLGNTAGDGLPGLTGTDTAAPLALNLLAAIDQTHPGWTLNSPEITAAQSTPTPTVSTSNILSIITPADGQQFILSPDQPASLQRLALKAAPNSPEKLWWFIDGSPIAQSAPAQTTWWTPTPGTHTLRVLSPTGQAATITIHVLTPEKPTPIQN